MWKHLGTRCFGLQFLTWQLRDLLQFDKTKTRRPLRLFEFPFASFLFNLNFTSRGHGSLTPSHANEAMEFRPEENVDAHSCTCFVTTFDKLLYYGVSQQISIAVRLIPDQLSTHVRLLSVELSIFFRRFPSNFQFHLNSTSTNYDNLVYDFSLMTGYFRTNFNVCVNRGLWDNLSLPRTIPDKHVELSSVCVCWFVASSCSF